MHGIRHAAHKCARIRDQPAKHAYHSALQRCLFGGQPAARLRTGRPHRRCRWYSNAEGDATRDIGRQSFKAVFALTQGRMQAKAASKMPLESALDLMQVACHCGCSSQDVRVSVCGDRSHVNLPYDAGYRSHDMHAFAVLWLGRAVLADASQARQIDNLVLHARVRSQVRYPRCPQIFSLSDPRSRPPPQWGVPNLVTTCAVRVMCDTNTQTQCQATYRYARHNQQLILFSQLFRLVCDSVYK